MKTQPKRAHVAFKAGAVATALFVSLGLTTSQVAHATTASYDPPEVQGTGLAETPEPTFIEVDFAHPVSLQSALTVKSAAGAEIIGYHFVSDSIVGDYFPGGGLSAEVFLADVAKKTGTAPEIVKAYIDGDNADKVGAGRVAEEVLGEALPAFDAPDAEPSPDFISADVPADRTERDQLNPLKAASSTWVPNDAEAMITPLTSQNLNILGKYSWWSLEPYASPLAMADHWGMEFQFDFYTTVRPNLNPYGDDYLGIRPFCGTTQINYKDWAAASTDPYTWVAMVISGDNQVIAPASLGMYGDFNDASDPCTVSTIAVGMAAPWAMPNSYGSNFLSISYYPAKGDDATSVVGAIVQPVSRTHCEQNPTMYLMDCMGVTPGAYPGPGTSSSRPVLNNNRGLRAPSLCWWSGGFGLDTSQFQTWSCDGGA